MGATLIERQSGPLTEADIAGAGDTRYYKRVATDVSATNLNSLTTPGFYWGSSLTNSPDGGTDFWYILVQQYPTNPAFVSQTAWGLNANSRTMFFRDNINGVWDTWSQILTSTMPTGFKNVIGRNGGMEVWQRGTSIAIPASSSPGLYTADGWYMQTGANQAFTVSRQAGLNNNSRYSAKVQRNSGQTGTGQVAFAIPLDTDELIKTLGNYVALSFTAKAGANYSYAASALGVYLPTGTGGVGKRGLSGYTGEVAAINSQVTLTTTAQRFTFISPAVVPVNATGMEFQFYMIPVSTAGADDSFYIDDVQLEVIPNGGIASAFERTDYGSDLIRCQRYFCTFSSLYLGLALNGSTLYNGALRFPATMRVAPTLQTGGTFTASAGGPGTVSVRNGPTVDGVGIQNGGTAWTATADVAITAGFSADI